MVKSLCLLNQRFISSFSYTLIYLLIFSYTSNFSLCFIVWRTTSDVTRFAVVYKGTSADVDMLSHDFAFLFVIVLYNFTLRFPVA